MSAKLVAIADSVSWDELVHREGTALLYARVSSVNRLPVRFGLVRTVPHSGWAILAKGVFSLFSPSFPFLFEGRFSTPEVGFFMVP